MRKATTQTRIGGSSKKTTSQKQQDSSPSPMSFDVDVTDTGLTRVSLNEYKGKKRIDIRHYYFNKEEGEFRPSPKGTSFDVAYAKRFAIRMRKLVTALIEEGIIDE